MGEVSKISWTDGTFNPWIGCTKIAPGCKFCYAERDSKRYGKDSWGWEPRIATVPAYWHKPIAINGRYDALSRAAGHRVSYRMFCASWADVFEEYEGPVVNHKKERLYVCQNNGQIVSDVSYGKWTYEPLTIAEIRRRLFLLIDATPYIDWLLLTKRPENILSMWPAIPCAGYDGGTYETHTTLLARSNVWLGTSVSEQKTADENIPKLLKCRDLSPVLFVSYEPALGPVNFAAFLPSELRTPVKRDLQFAIEGIDWLIAGGESGPHARPSHPQWFRDARTQALNAGIPFHYKQAGEWSDDHRGGHSDAYSIAYDGSHGAGASSDAMMYRVGKNAAGRSIDGTEYLMFPKGAE